MPTATAAILSIAALVPMWAAPITAALVPPANPQPIVELSQSRRAAVVSAWTSCGARVHVRPMPESRAVVALTITLVGGELLESDSNRGVSRLAAEAWEDQLEDDINELPVHGQSASVRVIAASDGLQIRLQGTAAQVEQAVGVVRAAMLHPAIDKAAVERAQRLVVDELKSDQRSGRSAIGAALVDAVFPPNEPRVRPMQRIRIESIGFEQVVQHLAWHAEHAPIEIGIAGDIAVEPALKLAGALVNELPARERVNADWRQDSRIIPLPAGPRERSVVGDTPPGMAIVLTGFLGADAARVSEFRTLRAASRVLDQRVRTRLRESGLVENNGATGSSLLYSPYPGFGMVLLSAVVPDQLADAARTILMDEVDRLTADGPTAEELTVATSQLAQEARAGDSDPAFWSGILSRSTIARLDPDQVIGGEGVYTQLAPADVRRVLLDRWTPESRVTVVVRATEKAAKKPG